MTTRRYRKTLTLEERFWPKVNKDAPNGCWEWTGALRTGYGLFWDGRAIVSAHRVSLDLHAILVPDGMVADHKCRNRSCVNPDHLRVVTPLVNTLENNVSPFAKNAAKTHCLRGHPLSGDNVKVYFHDYISKRSGRKDGTKRPGRVCQTCYRMRITGEIPKASPRTKDVSL